MNAMNSKVKQCAKKLVDSMVQQELWGWPPLCWGSIYQPERPMKPPLEAQPHYEEKEDDFT